MRFFGFWLIILTKINTNSAKICLLFRRKGIHELSGRAATPDDAAIVCALIDDTVASLLRKKEQLLQGMAL